MIEIAGNMLEGGGQILRNASALSCILRKPIKITNIRASRKQPGLRPQHLCGIQLVTEMCGGHVTGEKVSSTEIELTPGDSITGTSYNKQVGTAGSLTLLLQSALPLALFSSSQCDLYLGGGTNADMAPPIDYFVNVFSPIANKMGVITECSIDKRGFFPVGGGQVRVSVQAVKSITPITLTERGEITHITGLSYSAGHVPLEVAQKMAKQALQMLKRNMPARIPIDIETQYLPANQAVATGTGIFLTAYTSTGCIYGATGIGRKGKPGAQVAQEAVDQLTKSVKEQGCVDEFLQDQLIILMALAKGKSVIRSGPLTLHTETAIHIANTMTGVDFSVEQQEDGTLLISCTGLGYENSQVT